MNRHNQPQAGIKDQKNLLGFKKGPASYPDTALLLLWAVRGFQPSSAGREAPPWGSQLRAGAKRIDQGEVEWYLWGGLCSRVTGQREGLQATMPFTRGKRGKKAGGNHAEHLHY